MEATAGVMTHPRDFRGVKLGSYEKTMVFYGPTLQVWWGNIGEISLLFP